MKTVGILTHCPGRNYGGALQCYALQQVISRMGHACKVIDYRPLQIAHKSTCTKSGFARLSWMFTTTACECFSHFTVRRLQRGSRESHYRSFFDNCINLTETIYTNEVELLDNPPQFDVYVVGSDIVWHPRDESTYFLSFAPRESKRISYAASFGVNEIPTRYRERIAADLLKFDRISVRENRATEIVAELASKEAQWVLDPSLLLNPADWEKIAVQTDQRNPYVLNYFLNETPYMRQLSHQIGSELGLKIVSIAGGNMEFQTIRKQCEEYVRNKIDLRITERYDVGPREFLGLFKDARFLVTNSFHGMAFAIVFKIPFIAVLRKGLSSRQESLAAMLGLENRIINEGDSCPREINPTMDYDVISERLRSHQIRSLDFLRKALV